MPPRPALRPLLLATFTVAPTTLVAFVLTGLGALSAARLAALPLALVGGALVGLAERAAFARAGRTPSHHANWSSLAWLAWALGAGLAGFLLAGVLPDPGRPVQLVALTSLASLAGALPAGLLHARSLPAPSRRRFAVELTLTRVAAVAAATSIYRAGALFWGVAAGALVYALGVALATRPAKG